jgi:hypothetical protein
LKEDNQISSNENESKNILSITVSLFLAFLGGVVAIVFYGVTFFTSGNWFKFNTKLDEWGQTGDFFGGILNPFFTFIGLILVIQTIKQNQQALKLNEKELKLSREELQKSNEALQSQVKTAEKQRFENTFFALLEQHNRLLNILITPAQGKSFSTINSLLEHMNHNFTDKSLQDYKDELLNFDPIINQYFRVLYQTLKFIASNCPSSTISGYFIKGNLPPTSLETPKCSSEEKLYSNIVRSFLTNEIYDLLAINCYCSKDSDPFWTYKLLVERYSFFEHMSLELKGDKSSEKRLNNDAIKKIVNYYKDEDIAFGNKPYTEIQNILSS